MPAVRAGELPGWSGATSRWGCVTGAGRAVPADKGTWQRHAALCSPDALWHPKALRLLRERMAGREAPKAAGLRGSDARGVFLCWQQAGCTWAVTGMPLGCGSCVALHGGSRTPLSFEGQ